MRRLNVQYGFTLAFAVALSLLLSGKFSSAHTSIHSLEKSKELSLNSLQNNHLSFSITKTLSDDITPFSKEVESEDSEEKNEEKHQKHNLWPFEFGHPNSIEEHFNSITVLKLRQSENEVEIAKAVSIAYYILFQSWKNDVCTSPFIS